MFGTIGLQVVTTLILIFSSSWIMFVVLYFLLGVEQISNYLVTFVLGMSVPVCSTNPPNRCKFNVIYFCVQEQKS